MNQSLVAPQAQAPEDYLSLILRNVPAYFPPKDRLPVALHMVRYLDHIDAGGDGFDMLQYSENPKFIFQGRFAISESVPISLQGGGIGPCIGVMLMNERTGRSMAVHLEARDEDGERNIDEEARKFVKEIAELYGDAPTKIELVSLLGGIFPYHEAIRAALASQFHMDLPARYLLGTVVADPRKRSIIIDR